MVLQCESCGRYTAKREYNKIFNSLVDFCASCENFRESRLVPN